MIGMYSANIFIRCLQIFNQACDNYDNSVCAIDENLFLKHRVTRRLYFCPNSGSFASAVFRFPSCHIKGLVKTTAIHLRLAFLALVP
jgi:hypothetical protein